MLASAGTADVTVFVEPEAGTAPITEFIGGARRQLDVAMYLLTERSVIEAIEDAEQRGVRTRILLEEHPYGTGPGNREIAQTLRDAQVEVRWSPAKFRLSHAKYAVVDGKEALIGTANWTHSAFTNNREYIIIDSDPTDVAQLSALFEADWMGQDLNAEAMANGHLVISPSDSRLDFIALIEGAQRSLDLQAEEVQDAQIEEALIRAAARGVEVRLLTSPGSGPSDANAAGRSRLRQGGVEVRLLEYPYVHAKDIIVDRQTGFVGSENISTASLDDNREVGVIIGDTQVISTLEETFSRDWQAAR